MEDTKMTKYRWSLLIVGSSLLLLSSFSLGSLRNNNKLLVYEYVKPFLWGENTSGRPGYKDFSFFLDSTKLHPLGLGSYAFFNLWQGTEDNNPELLNIGRKYIDYLAQDYPFVQRNGNATLYNYPFTHKEYKAGEWHSGMANSIIALSFLQAYIIFDEPSYLRYAEQAMMGVTEEISKGGSALKVESGKWFLEYASKTIDHDKARFVLNGFLYQLLALKLYCDITGDEYFIKEYKSGLLAYQDLYEQFHYESGDWTYYSLNPKSVETPHYVIFDIILLDALYELTNETVFNVESSYRRNILRKHYNLESIPLNRRQGIYCFSQVGPPHPYWVDIYPTTIRFLSENDSKEIYLKNPREVGVPIESRCFSIDTLTTDKYRIVEVWAVYHSDSVLLFESKIENIKHAIEPDIFPDYDLMTNLLAEKESSKRAIIQNPASGTNLNRGAISVQFDQVFIGNKDKYLGIVINSQKKFTSLRIFLTNTLNERASRYYLNTLDSGKDNLILISVNGFGNIEQLTNTNFSSLELHFYNVPPKEDSPYSIDIKNVVFFQSNYNLLHFLKRRPAVIFTEKKTPGFLY
ncbi:MAG: hypothetical protein KAR19_06395 [Bacteroidales bacterium]|nr:hypothetical protein [Bacteroidales bacterium]